MKKEKNEGRLKWLEALRGAAIFLVVLGHITLSKSSQGYEVMHAMIYSFHMPLFFSMSGFLFGYREWENEAGFIIKKKMISLGLPYLWFSVAYILLNVVMQKYITTNTRVQLLAVPSLLYRPVAHYWFLYVLLVYYLLGTAMKKYRGMSYLTAISSVLIFLVGNWVMPEMMNSFVLKASSYYFIFFGATELGRRYKDILTGGVQNSLHLKEKSLSVVSFAVMILFLTDGIIFYKMCFDKLALFSCSVNKLILMISGIFTTCGMIRFASKSPIIVRILCFIGNGSWYIYLLHSYFLSVARALMARFHVDSSVLSAGGGYFVWNRRTASGSLYCQES